MAFAKLGSKSIGSIVKIKVNGSAQNFIVVHQGLPGSMYDASCNGSWLLMQGIYANIPFGTTSNIQNSNVNSYLNGTFYNQIEEKVRNVIKPVKLPYRPGGDASSTKKGADGYSTKIFPLSNPEIGNDRKEYGDGAKLDYFIAGGSNWGSDACKRRQASGAGTDSYWTRTPNGTYYAYADIVSPAGYVTYSDSYWSGESYGVRPCMILSPNALVDDSGNIIINTAPTVGFSSGAALGEQNEPFSAGYTVTDADGDTLTVTEKLDGTVTATRTGVASGTAMTFGQTAAEETFRRILNGSHTMEIVVSDGIESAGTKATFTKAVHKATVTLAEPLAVEGDITVAILQVSGSIPDDASFKAEATNNALDDSPVWQDVTAEVRKGMNIAFTNKTAANGAAFNFRITAERGVSGEGGYIKAVTGAFQ